MGLKLPRNVLPIMKPNIFVRNKEMFWNTLIEACIRGWESSLVINAWEFFLIGLLQKLKTGFIGQIEYAINF